MKKLNLDTDELRVESFATAEDRAPERGTVHARGLSGLACGAGNSSGAPVCYCDTTYTQRAPECDPSAETYCIDAESLNPCCA